MDFPAVDIELVQGFVPVFPIQRVSGDLGVKESGIGVEGSLPDR